MAADELARCYQANCDALILYAKQWLAVDLAQEAVQQAFLRLIRQRHRPDNLKAWLYRCVRNEALNQVRREHRQSKREQQVAANRQEWFESDLSSRLDAKLAQEALESLDQDHREVVVLRIWSGLVLREISEITGQSVSSVFRTYSEALAAIRRKLVTPCKKTQPE